MCDMLALADGRVTGVEASDCCPAMAGGEGVCRACAAEDEGARLVAEGLRAVRCAVSGERCPGCGRR